MTLDNFTQIANAVGSSGLVTAGSSVANTVITNHARKKEAELKFQRDQQLIREQNAYNSPASQVVRLKAAGLNPALAYGGAGEVTGNQLSAAEYTPPNYEAAAFSDSAELVRSMVDVRQQLNNNAQNEADLALKDAKTFLAYSQEDLNSRQADRLTKLLCPELNLINAKIQSEWSNQDLNYSSIEVNNERLKEIGQNINLLAEKVRVTNFELQRMVALLPKELIQMDANNRLLWIQGDQGQQWIAESLNRMSLDAQMVGIAAGRLDLDTDALRIHSNQFNRSMDLSESQFDEVKRMNKFTRRKGWVDTAISGYSAYHGNQTAQETLTQDWTLGLTRLALMYGTKMPMVAVP